MSIKTAITVALLKNQFLTTTQIRWALKSDGQLMTFAELTEELDKMVEQGLVEKAKRSNGWKWRLL